MNDYMAVWVALLQFSYCDGRPVDPHERNLCANLLQLGETYGASGHYIAYELDKLLHQVRVMPLTAPEHPNWFLATMESRLKRRTHATRVNLPATQSPMAARYLTPLMESTALEPSPAEILAREFLKRSEGIKFQAVQAIIGAVRGSGPLEGHELLEALFWMLKEGWSREFPVSGTVVKFEPRSETGQSEGKKRA